MQRTDAQLVLAARDGDRNAFAELVRRHHGVVYAAALSIARDWGAAEDIAQDAFLSAWSNLSELRAPGAFSHWARRIARNLALNWVRSRAYRDRLAERYAGESSEMADPTSARGASDDERRELLAALDRVNASVREVVVLFYLEEKTVRETALALGITEAAVKKRLQRGREALRVALEAQWAQAIRDTGAAKNTEARVSRVLQGLAIGPAIPEAGYAAAKWTLGHSIAEAARSSAWLKPALAGGAAMTGKHVAVGVAVVVAAALAIYWTTGPGETPSSESLADSGAQHAGAPGQPSGDAETTPDDATMARTPALLPFELPIDDPGDDPSEPEDELAVPDASETDEPVDEDEPAVGEVLVAGLVVDEWGDAISEMEVFAVGHDVGSAVSSLAMAKELAHQRRTQAGPDGSFSFKVPSDVSPISLNAVSERYQGVAGAEIKEGVDVTDVRIVVHEGEPLLGRILSEDRKPVAGVSIQSVAHMSTGSAHGGRLRFAVSDGDGYFVLLFEQPGFAALRVISQTHGEQMFLPVAIGEEDPVELVLQSPAVLNGTIRYADGRLATDVRVRAETQVVMESEGSAVVVSGSPYSVATNERGEYEFTALAPDVAYVVHVTPLNSTSELSPRVNLGPFQSRDSSTHDFTLVETIAVFGLLLDGEGNPVPGSGLRVTSEEDPAATTSVEADASGNYALNVVSGPGRYQFVPGYKLSPANVIESFAPHLVQTIDLRAGDANEVNVTMDTPLTIALRVTDANGRPISGADINPQWNPVENSAYGFGSVGQTDAQGLHTWSGYAPIGTYRFWMRKDGHLARETEVFAGGPGEVFSAEAYALYQPSSLEGRVNLEGQGLEGTNLRINASRDGEQIASVTVTPASDGYFLARDSLPATTVELEFSLSHQGTRLAPSQSRELAFGPGETVDVGNIQFDAE